MRRQTWFVVLGVVAAAGLWAPRATAVGPLSVDPSPIAVGTFFRGTVVTVRGTTEPGASVFVVISGRAIEERFNRKGRFGPLWATVGSVAISGVPNLHLVAGERPAATMLPREVVDEHLLDVDAVARRASFEAPAGDRELLQREYVKLKRQEGVLGSFDGAVRIDRTTAPAAFTAEVPWPDAAVPGEYQVQAIHVREGAVVARQVEPLVVEYVGLPRLVSLWAFERSLWYGIGAVVIAVGVGFLMGLVFKKGGGGH